MITSNEKAIELWTTMQEWLEWYNSVRRDNQEVEQQKLEVFFDKFQEIFGCRPQWRAASKENGYRDQWHMVFSDGRKVPITCRMVY
jgi:hypothetical protein